MVEWKLFKESVPTKSGEYLVLVKDFNGSYSLKNEYWFDGLHDPFKPNNVVFSYQAHDFEFVSDGYVGFVEYDYDTETWHDLLLRRPCEHIAWVSFREFVEDLAKIFEKEVTKR